MSQTPSVLAAFGELYDVASAALGGKTLACSDDFFAGMENLLEPGRGVFIADKYTERGKWMDGWESRRKRVPGHDWCIIELGVPSLVRAVDIDTNHFLGNHPPFASVDALCLRGDEKRDASTLRTQAAWKEIVPEVPLRAGSQNLFTVAVPQVCTHLRLNILPDGGVARFRVWGEPQPEPTKELVDLASATRGAQPIACSDMFFSSMQNLLMPSESANMGDGWETRRKRSPGHDWIIVQLSDPGAIERIEIDTRHFKGNYPDRASIEAIHWPNAPASQLARSEAWRPLLKSSKLRADAKHEFDQLEDRGSVTHLRLNIFPCGGVARLRAWGRTDATAPEPLDALNGLGDDEATDALMRCCGSKRWAVAMCARRPFASRAELFGAADSIWWRLDDADWREAFTHHPQIGADVDALREKFATTAKLSESEQAGVQGASEQTLQSLAKGNAAYLKRFGYIFIVCASGKSADEMLALLQERSDNEPTSEIRIAAGEQAKITRLRLEKLL